MRSVFIFLALILSIAAQSFAGPFVSNLSIFLGEVASGLTVGAPLSVSATGKVASGLSSTEVTATATTTTTSTTDVLINSMTTTPVAGTYIVWFHTTLQSNTNNVNVFVSIYAGGVQAAGSEMDSTPQIQGGLTPSLNSNVPIGTINTVTVNGSQAIEARWRVSAAATATALSRTLQILRVQ